MVDRGKIEALVRAALVEQAARAGDREPAPTETGGGLLLRPDRGVNLAAPFDPEAMRGILGATPARIAVGRVGVRYRTNTLLRFRADHAAAKDAVFSEVDPALVARLGLVELRTEATDKRHFLTRPDAGRTLSAQARATIAERCVRGPQVQLVYGDGLSAAALNEHLEPLHAALVQELGARGLRIGTPLFVRYARVKVMDEVARLVEAEACVFACGERPGLGFADSLSAYFIYRPAEGATDAQREVISNINPRGLPPAQAARAVAEACVRVLRDRRSGVVAG